MSINNVSFFLPTRKGSERVINKNTRPFATEQDGILGLKIKQLLNVTEVNDIIISTNDVETMRIAASFDSDRIKIIERPEHLCLSSTIIEHFIDYIPSVIDTEHIFWVHATAPFVNADDYSNALRAYFEGFENGYDSLLSVTKIQQFLWDADTRNFLNHDRNTEKWPRTQDLKAVYEINHAFYINSRRNYLKYHDRIGKNPFLYELDKIRSFDIDWDDDFKIAEIIYKELIVSN